MRARMQNFMRYIVKELHLSAEMEKLEAIRLYKEEMKMPASEMKKGFWRRRPGDKIH